MDLVCDIGSPAAAADARGDPVDDDDGTLLCDPSLGGTVAFVVFVSGFVLESSTYSIKLLGYH